MNENKYEQRVWQQAEEFYNEARKALGIVEPDSSDNKEETISKLFIPLANCSIHREAEAAKHAFEAGQVYMMRLYNNGRQDYNDVQHYLQSLGLVPPTEPAPVPGTSK